MNKVDELVNWVAKKIWLMKYGEDEWMEPDNKDYIDVAKQILSHPDLALIDRNVSSALKWERINKHPGDHTCDSVAGISIKDCPKCKHPVMAKESLHTHPHTWATEEHDYTVNSDGGGLTYKTYQCLVCGVKFTCSEKCVCKIINEKDE